MTEDHYIDPESGPPPEQGVDEAPAEVEASSVSPTAEVTPAAYRPEHSGDYPPPEGLSYWPDGRGPRKPKIKSAGSIYRRIVRDRE